MTSRVTRLALPCHATCKVYLGLVFEGLEAQRLGGGEQGAGGSGDDRSWLPAKRSCAAFTARRMLLRSGLGAGGRGGRFRGPSAKEMATQCSRRHRLHAPPRIDVALSRLRDGRSESRACMLGFASVSSVTAAPVIGEVAVSS